MIVTGTLAFIVTALTAAAAALAVIPYPWAHVAAAAISAATTAMLGGTAFSTRKTAQAVNSGQVTVTQERSSGR